MYNGLKTVVLRLMMIQRLLLLLSSVIILVIIFIATVTSNSSFTLLELKRHGNQGRFETGAGSDKSVRPSTRQGAYNKTNSVRAEKQASHTKSAPEDRMSVSSMSTDLRFLFVVGSEGTGHHFLDVLMKASPLQTLFKSERVAKAHRELLKSLFSKERLDGFFNFQCFNSTKLPKDMGSAEALAKRLISLRNLVRRQGGAKLSVVPLNALKVQSNRHHGMMSYPNYASSCRPLQFPDLDALYYACDLAKVSCSHLVIYRDPYAVIKSTTINRKFSGLAMQLKVMASMMAVIHAQVLNQEQRQWWCWEFGRREGSDAIRAALGWKDEDSDKFRASFDAKFHEQSINASEYSAIVPPHLAAHMQSMLLTTQRLHQTCQQHAAGVGTGA